MPADVLDLPGLKELLRGLQTREIALVEVETPAASPFASSLLFDYVATYMYEGDTPTAERRAAALSLDRDLLRELLGQEELRELIDPGALARVEDDLQCRSEMTRATGRDGLHDVLRRVGDLTAAELARARVRGGRRGRPARRAGARTTGGRASRRRRAALIAADEAGLYRDALGAAPPGGLPEAFLADVPDALRELSRATPARTGRSPPTSCARATASTPARCCASSSATGELVRGELRPGGSERDWCDVEVLRRLRRASLAALRKEIEPADQRRLAAFLPSWQGVDRHTARRRGHRPPARGARAAAGPRAARRDAGSATCCRGAPAPTRRPGWTRSARAASSSGSARARSGARAAWRSTSARTPPRSGRRAARARRAARRRAAPSTS